MDSDVVVGGFIESVLLDQMPVMVSGSQGCEAYKEDDRLSAAQKRLVDVVVRKLSSLGEEIYWVGLSKLPNGKDIVVIWLDGRGLVQIYGSVPNRKSRGGDYSPRLFLSLKLDNWNRLLKYSNCPAQKRSYYYGDRFSVSKMKRDGAFRSFCGRCFSCARIGYKAVQDEDILAVPSYFISLSLPKDLVTLFRINELEYSRVKDIPILDNKILSQDSCERVNRSAQKMTGRTMGELLRIYFFKIVNEMISTCSPDNNITAKAKLHTTGKYLLTPDIHILVADLLIPNKKLMKDQVNISEFEIMRVEDSIDWIELYRKGLVVWSDFCRRLLSNNQINGGVNKRSKALDAVKFLRGQVKEKAVFDQYAKDSKLVDCKYVDSPDDLMRVLNYMRSGWCSKVWSLRYDSKSNKLAITYRNGSKANIGVFNLLTMLLAERGAITHSTISWSGLYRFVKKDARSTIFPELIRRYQDAFQTTTPPNLQTHSGFSDVA